MALSLGGCKTNSPSLIANAEMRLLSKIAWIKRKDFLLHKILRSIK